MFNGATVVGRVEGASNGALCNDEVSTGVVEGGTVLGDRFPIVGLVVGGTVCTDWGDTFVVVVGVLDVVVLTEVACAWLFRHLPMASFPG